MFAIRGIVGTRSHPSRAQKYSITRIDRIGVVDIGFKPVN